jgi:uncharacterized protein DUF6788
VSKTTADRRAELIATIAQLAEGVVFGSLSEIYRTCGTPSCRCHGPGPKHGPHLQIGWPGDNGKTTGCYVPIAAQPLIRAGAADWQSLQAALRELGALNRDAIIAEARNAKLAAREKRPGTPRTAGRPSPRQAGTTA